jgi:hypothetical protein
MYFFVKNREITGEAMLAGMVREKQTPVERVSNQ